MDTLIFPVTAAQPAPAPLVQVDMRPTADTAALVRDPRPETPMPMPASIAQKGAIAEWQLATTFSPVASIERVLKPYGVVMLPHGPQADLAGAEAGVEEPEDDASGVTPDAATPTDTASGQDTNDRPMPDAPAGQPDAA
ncbi:hypothetical protein ACOI1H_12815 [Loktanella sp. DJP18]|uniref:hypothetical protein n=1 Tax=Loktanella sp. DJP18 TaxID=3409788 RepID=UPI003BB7F24B